MLPEYIRVCEVPFLHPSRSSSLTFEHIRDGIMRQLIICGEGILWSFDNDIKVKDRGREAGPASFVEKLSTQCILAKCWG